jgi:hypothetical protein
MKTISKLIAISSLAFGCATGQVGRNAGAVANVRGDVVVSGPTVKAVMVGPADIHAYAAYAGGAIYTVPAVSGGDADCAAARAGVTTLQADRVHAVRVESGQVACLATAGKGSFELLWHVQQPKKAATPVEIASSASHPAR